MSKIYRDGMVLVAAEDIKKGDFVVIDDGKAKVGTEFNLEEVLKRIYEQH
jgi:hypothetical protein